MSTANPYAAPTAAVADPVPSIPPDIAKKIKSAWVAGCISGAVTLAVTLLAMAGTQTMGFSAWSLLDVALIFGLSFGIYKKSRTCAVVMLVYFVTSKIILMMEARAASGLLVALVFGYFYVQGILGIFAFHKFKAAQAAEAQRAA
ncbi:MAG: hypothetical protein JNL93_13735 [Pelomonas sp.]|nr:hypothetical protein [Roseateles sp.]